MTIHGADELLPSPPAGQLPVVQVNGRQLGSVVEDAWRAVHAANNPPFLFLHDGRLVQRVAVGDGQIWPHRVSAAGLFGILIRVADWMRATPRGLVDTKPPRSVVAVMRRSPDPALPVL